MRIFMQTRPEPDNPARFYQLILQEDLLGGWTLIRQWGRVGERGTSRQEFFDDVDSAQDALTRYRRRQAEQGFRVTFVQGE